MKLDLAGAVKAVQMLGLLADYFDGGDAPWTKWVHTDDDGGRCLIGAMDLLRKRHRLYGDATRYYLLEAAGGLGTHSRASTITDAATCRSCLT